MISGKKTWKYAPKKFSTTKTSLESFQISTWKEGDSEVKKQEKRTFSVRTMLSNSLQSDLYIDQKRFIYRSFSFYIQIVFHLYTDRIWFIYSSDGSKGPFPSLYKRGTHPIRGGIECVPYLFAGLAKSFIAYASYALCLFLRISG